MKNRLIRFFWIFAGTSLFLLGIIGIFLPVLPVIPFWILASACFFRGSKKAHDLFNRFVLKNELFEKYVKKYLTEENIFWVKIVLIGFSWISASFSFFFVLSSFILRFGLVAVVLGTTIFILAIKPLKDHKM